MLQKSSVSVPYYAGAPIGGVLFSLEEACSVWSRRIAWRCFLATAVAVIVNVALNPHLSGGLLAVGLRPLGPSEWLQQLPALVAVSAGGGLLGAAFNKLRLAVKPWRAHPKQHAARVREVVAVAALTVSCIAGLSAAVGRCLPVPPHWEAEGQEEVWLQHTCPAGHYNDLATAWLSPSGALCCAVGECCSAPQATPRLLTSHTSTPLVAAFCAPRSVEHPIIHFSGHQAGAAGRGAGSLGVL